MGAGGETGVGRRAAGSGHGATAAHVGTLHRNAVGLPGTASRTRSAGGTGGGGEGRALRAGVLILQGVGLALQAFCYAPPPPVRTLPLSRPFSLRGRRDVDLWHTRVLQ